MKSNKKLIARIIEAQKSKPVVYTKLSKKKSPPPPVKVAGPSINSLLKSN